jgi:hypothetical protein
MTQKNKEQSEKELIKSDLEEPLLKQDEVAD